VASAVCCKKRRRDKEEGSMLGDSGIGFIASGFVLRRFRAVGKRGDQAGAFRSPTRSGGA
jgi:hypothetical protein